MITFNTNIIDQKLYKNIIKSVLNKFDVDVPIFLNDWTITFYPLNDTIVDFFGHVPTTDGVKINPNMASGVTGKYDIKFFLHDDTNEFLTRENSDRVQHELCHAVLFSLYGSKGQINWVKAVHDNSSKRFIINLWYWRGIRLVKLPLSVIDIRLYV